MVTDSRVAAALALHGQAMRVPKSATVFEAGERADGIYILRSGSVTVQLLNEQQCPVWSRTLTEAGILGLPAAIRQQTHDVRAVASEHSEMIFVTSETLAKLIEIDPELGGRVLVLISEELSGLRRKAAMLNGRFKSHSAS
jgi:CRP/FNR family transcriptional regulator